VDSGVYAGYTVPLDYDPMLAKLIVHAATREDAIRRMERALDEYVVGGIKTNLGLFRRILNDAEFRAGKMDTGSLDRILATPQKPSVHVDEMEVRIAAIAAVMFAKKNDHSPTTVSNGAAAVSSTIQPTQSAGKSSWKETARRDSLH